jgi:hypothetical protein
MNDNDAAAGDKVQRFEIARPIFSLAEEQQQARPAAPAVLERNCSGCLLVCTILILFTCRYI